MREEVEPLEDHTHLAPHLIYVDVRVGDALSAEEYLACSGFLKQVKAAQERALARSGRSDDHDYFVWIDSDINPAQHMVTSETLLQSASSNQVPSTSFQTRLPTWKLLMSLRDR